MDSSKRSLCITGCLRILETLDPPDFCIKLRQETISVRKEVLISASHYFCCLFNSGMQEVRNQTLNLEDLNPKVVKSLMAYMYGMDIIIEWDEVTDYLDIVECWQITELKSKLEQYV